MVNLARNFLFHSLSFLGKKYGLQKRALVWRGLVDLMQVLYN